MTFTRTLRLRITPDRVAGVIDADTGNAPEFWSGSPVRIRLALFAGVSGDTLWGDFSDIGTIEVQLKSPGSGGVAPADTSPPLASATTGTFAPALTLAAWNAGHGAHAELVLSGAQMALARGKLWVAVVAHRLSSPDPVTLAAGPVSLMGDGYSPGAGDPPPAPPAYPSPVALAGLFAALADEVVARAAGDTAEAQARAQAIAALATSIASSLTGKVDKVIGKALSSNDYSDAEKAKLFGISGTNTGDQDISGIAVNAAALAAEIARAVAAEATKAPLASPALTGTPTAPTAAPGTASTQLATTAFVRSALDALVAAAPGALDTLSELASALGNDPNFAATVTTALAGKALRAPTPTAGHLATLDAFGNPLDSGYKIAKDNTFAGDNEVMLGGDWRNGLKGGYALAGANAAISGYGTAVNLPLSDHFEIVALIEKDAGDLTLRSLFGVTTTAGQVSLNVGNAYEAHGLWTVSFGDLIYFYTTAPDKPAWVAWGRDETDFYVRLNGTKTYGRGEISPGERAVAISRVFGGIYAGFGQMSGRVRTWQVFNTSLSDTEFARIMRGDIQAIDMAGLVARFPADSVAPSGAWPSTVGGYIIFPGAGITPLAPNPGLTRTIRCVATDVSVSAGAEANAAFSGISTQDIVALSALQPGWGCEWTPDTDMPDGLMTKRGARIPAVGSANLRLINLTAGALNSGAVTGTLTITLR